MSAAHRLPTPPRPWPWPAVLLSVLALLWAITIPVTAAVASASPGEWPVAVSVVHAIGQAICHQRPERSFAWGLMPWPVCARCTGLYVGAAAGAILGWIPAARPVAARHVRWSLALAAVPGLVTLLSEWTSGQAPSNAMRAATGVLLGAATAWWLVRFLREPLAGRPRRGAEVN